MASLLKNLPLDQYARHVGQVLQQRHGDHQTLSGQEILKATEFGQLNLMILWLIKTEWGQEAARLHSPYFNYQAPEVRQSIEQLMGVLSMNIAVTPPVLGDLAGRAILEIFRLLDDTERALIDRFDQQGAPALSIKTVQQELKYLPLIAPLVSEPLRHLTTTGRDTILRGEWVRTVHSAIRDRQSVLRNTIESQLAQIAPPDEFVPEVPEEEPPAPTSFFDQLEIETPMVESSSPVSEPMDWVQDPNYEPAPPTFRTDPEPAYEAPAAPEPEPEPLTALYEPEPVIEPQLQHRPEPHTQPAHRPGSVALTASALAAGSLLERFAQESHDSSPTLLGRIGTSGPRLSSAFTIGERFFLQSELFDKKADALSSCIEDLDNQTCLSDALSRLEGQYQVTHQWSRDNEAYKTLEQAVRRRYA